MEMYGFFNLEKDAEGFLLVFKQPSKEMTKLFFFPANTFVYNILHILAG